MNKKKLIKKLTLNKEKIASLNFDEMSEIKGASILFVCTESCSIFIMCCDPTSKGCPEEKKIGNG